MGLNGAKALGASGAVSGVLLLCAAHYPSMTVRMFFLFPMPIWTFVIVNIALDSFVFISQKDTGVAVACHLGGAAFAWVYYKRQWHLSGFGRRFQVWWKRMSGPKLRVYREEPRQPVPVGGPPLYEKDEQLEAKLDAVLAKVARTGQSSLTDAERQVLLQASERYKRKRT